MIHTAPALLFWLLVAHALCDYPLQGDFLARGKNQRNPLPGVPWEQCLGAHALIHGGAAALLTGSIGIGVLEAAWHFFIDFGKTEGRYSFRVDQALHVGCKLLWVLGWSLQ